MATHWWNCIDFIRSIGSFLNLPHLDSVLFFWLLSLSLCYSMSVVLKFETMRFQELPCVYKALKMKAQYCFVRKSMDVVSPYTCKRACLFTMFHYLSHVRVLWIIDVLIVHLYGVKLYRNGCWQFIELVAKISGGWFLDGLSEIEPSFFCTHTYFSRSQQNRIALPKLENSLMSVESAFLRQPQISGYG